MHRVITTLGYVFFYAGVAFILLCYAGIVLTAPSIKEGLAQAWEVGSPFNFTNILITIAVLAPGVVLVSLGRKLRLKKEGAEPGAK